MIDFLQILTKACTQDEMSMDSYLNLALCDIKPYDLMFKKENIFINKKN